MASHSPDRIAFIRLTGVRVAEGAGDDRGSQTGLQPGEAPARPRKATVGDLFAEFRRRHIFRVVIGYGVFALAVLQASEPLIHGLHQPEWVLTVVIAVLALGFPVALILAWVYDLTRQGVTRTAPAAGPGAVSFSRGRLAGLLIGVGILGALPGIAWYAWKWHGERGGASGAPKESPSIAVLPFVDLSPPKDQDYFSEGVAGEILDALSRVRGLRVPGRSVSFWFKGKNVEPAEISRKLGVTHLLEGTVQRSGSRLRITAEVVNASSGGRIWSQSYEREIADIFTIQDEIARSVVLALAPVLLASSAPVPSPRTSNPEAYRLFLLGRFLNGQFTQESLEQAVEALERSAALDPRFAPTQAWLAFAYGNLSGRRDGPESLRLRKAAREAAEKAVALDPSSAWGYAPRAWYRTVDRDWEGAAADLERGLAIDPASETMLNAQAMFLLSQGRTREAVDVQRRTVERDPLSAVHTFVLSMALFADEQYVEAREWARRAQELSPGLSQDNTFGWVALRTGNPGEALAHWERLPDGPARIASTAIALHALGRERESLDAATRLEREAPEALHLIAGVRAWRGDLDGAFEALDRVVREQRASLWNAKFDVRLVPLRGDPRWKELLRKLNLPVE
jgi:TolB-like protein